MYSTLLFAVLWLSDGFCAYDVDRAAAMEDIRPKVGQLRDTDFDMALDFYTKFGDDEACALVENVAPLYPWVSVPSYD